MGSSKKCHHQPQRPLMRIYHHLLFAFVACSLPASARGMSLLFDGPYTLINKHNGNRIAAQKGFDDTLGFFLIDRGPIYDDQKWNFESQGDQMYSIANAFDGRRVLAHTSGSLGAALSGPISPAEKWIVEPQEDGAYLIRSALTAQHIAAQDSGLVSLDSGPTSDIHRWWLMHMDGQAATQKSGDISKLMDDLQVEREARIQGDRELLRLRSELDAIEKKVSLKDKELAQSGRHPPAGFGSLELVAIAVLLVAFMLALRSNSGPFSKFLHRSSDQSVQLPLVAECKTTYI